MGGSTSKSTVESITTISNDVINRNILTCATYVEQEIDKDVVIGGHGTKVDNITFENIAKVDVKCIQNADVASAISADLQKSIDQYVESSAKGFLSALGRSKAEAKIKLMNQLKNKLTTENIQKCASTVLQSQKGDIIIGGVDVEVGSIAVRNISDSIVQCMSANVIDNELKSIEKIDASSSSISEVDASIFGFLSGFKNVFLGIAAFILLIILLNFARDMLGGSDDGGEYEGEYGNDYEGDYYYK